MRIINVRHALHFFARSENLENNLEKLRKEKHITQEELADILKVSRQTISSIENGRYEPSINLAFKLALFFNKTIEEIFIYRK